MNRNFLIQSFFGILCGASLFCNAAGWDKPVKKRKKQATRRERQAPSPSLGSFLREPARNALSPMVYDETVAYREEVGSGGENFEFFVSGDGLQQSILIGDRLIEYDKLSDMNADDFAKLFYVVDQEMRETNRQFDFWHTCNGIISLEPKKEYEKKEKEGTLSPVEATLLRKQGYIIKLHRFISALNKIEEEKKVIEKLLANVAP